MSGDLGREVHEALRRGQLLRFTRQAYRMLPPLPRPCIVDVGCGRGEPTLELAQLSGGLTVGLDIDGSSLEQLARQAGERGMQDRVAVVRASMVALCFAPESLDLIWAEGSLSALGFQRALIEWRPLLKPSGFLVVHEPIWLQPGPPPEIVADWSGSEPISTLEEILARIPALGYDVVGHVTLPEDAWWDSYYVPLQARIRELRIKYARDACALATLDEEQRNIDRFASSRRWYGSAFILMQKAG